MKPIHLHESFYVVMGQEIQSLFDEKVLDEATYV